MLAPPLRLDVLNVLQMLAGLLGPATNWRLPFLVMAAPTLLLALLLLLTVEEPPRGGEPHTNVHCKQHSCHALT